MIKKGIYTALVTPFDENGEIDYCSLEKILKMQLQAKVSGIVALGTTAESPTLEQNEKEKILDFVINNVGEKIAVVAGAGTNCTKTTLEQIKWLNTKRIDAILLSLPAYNKPNESGLLKHIELCCKISTHPIIIYYVPSRSGQVLSAETLKRICKNKKIVGIKDASGNLDLFFAATTFKKNFMVLSGNDDQFFATLKLGGSGIISVASNAIPKTMVKIANEFFDDNKKTARFIFERILPLVRLMFVETNPVPIKYILAKKGICLPNVRLPLGPLCKQSKDKIDEIIKRN